MQGAVIGSANFTINKRYEAGIITSVPGIVSQYLDTFKKALDSAIPYKIQEKT